MNASAAPCRGFTLLELAAVVAVVAVVATAAMPSLHGWIARQRLKAAAEQLAVHLNEARFEAVRRRVPLHFSGLSDGRVWCWAIGTAPGLNCGLDQPSALRLVRHGDHRGVQLAEVQAASFDPRDGHLLAPSGGALLKAATGEALRVRLTPLGRALTCSPDGAMPQVARCP